MKLTPLALEGVFLIAPEPIGDTRGFFARTFCAETFAAQGFATHFVQANLSFTAAAGTVRGLHCQRPPHAEAKIVRCTRGRVFDVAVDLRTSSPSYGRAVSAELSAENRHALYIPEGFAHGFQTLSDDCEMHYLHSAAHAPGFEAGIAHDDPDIGLPWPLPVSIVSERDRALPRLRVAGVIFP